MPEPTSRRMFTAPLTNVEIRQSGADANHYTLVGHAAIFGDIADLGDFTEELQPGCFRQALETSTTHLLWNHNSDMPLASTDSSTLDLQEDELGLRVWARIPKTLSYAADLRTLMETGIATGMSFAFTLPEDGSGETWTRDNTGRPHRTITNIAGLYDVSATARGAYSAPQYAMRSGAEVETAEAAGLLSKLPDAQPEVAVEAATANDQTVGMAAMRAEALAALKADANRRLRVAKARNQ